MKMPIYITIMQVLFHMILQDGKSRLKRINNANCIVFAHALSYINSVLNKRFISICGTHCKMFTPLRCYHKYVRLQCETFMACNFPWLKHLTVVPFSSTQKRRHMRRKKTISRVCVRWAFNRHWFQCELHTDLCSISVTLWFPFKMISLALFIHKWNMHSKIKREKEGEHEREIERNKKTIFHLIG